MNAVLHAGMCIICFTETREQSLLQTLFLYEENVHIFLSTHFTQIVAKKTTRFQIFFNFFCFKKVGDIKEKPSSLNSLPTVRTL